MKSFTDIEQSKKLTEILPIETADMWYAEVYEGKIVGYDYIVSDTPYYSLSFVKPSENNYSQNTVKDIPCWSLSSLLEIINKDFYTDLYHDGELWTVDVQHHDNGEISDFVYDDEPIDACVKIIVKLKEKGVL